MDWKKEYSLLLLAGGRSRRMGQDKGKLIFEGKTFVEGLLEKGRALGIGPLFLSGAAKEKEAGPGFEGVRIVPDLYPDRGPLGGMYACMSVMRTPYCLVLPVDVPQIPPVVLEELLRRHRELAEKGEGKKPLLLRHGDRVEPLIGVYPTELGKMAGEAVRNGGARVFSLLDKCGYFCCEVQISPKWVDNINTPEAYEKLAALQRGEVLPDLRQGKELLDLQKNKEFLDPRKSKELLDPRKDEGLSDLRKSKELPDPRKDEGLPDLRKSKELPDPRKDEGLSDPRKDEGLPDLRKSKEFLDLR